MQITLSKELEEFVMYQLRSGAYADANQLVQEALENLREAMPDPALEQMLLEAHESSATPLTAEDFEAVRRLLRESRSKAA